MPTEMFRPEVPETPEMWDRIEDRLRNETRSRNPRPAPGAGAGVFRPMAGALAGLALLVALPMGLADTTEPAATTTPPVTDVAAQPEDRQRIFAPNADLSLRIPEF